MSQAQKPTRLLRKPAVLDRVGLSDSELQRRINAKVFPKPLKIGVRSVAWTEASIDEWIASIERGNPSERE